MHEAAWDGRNANGLWAVSGIYLLRIEVRYTDGSKERLMRKVAVIR